MSRTRRPADACRAGDYCPSLGVADEHCRLAASQIESIGSLEDDIAFLHAIGHIEDALVLLPDPFYYHHISRESALIGQPSLRSGFPWRKDHAPEEALPGKAIRLAQIL